MQLTRVTLLLLTLSIPATLLKAQNITLTPSQVESGSPELIRLKVPNSLSVEGSWLGHSIHFFESSDHQTWYALTGVDVETPPSDSTLKITVKTHGDSKQINTLVTIHPAHYRTSSITVPPKFVEPGPDELKEVNIDREIKARIFAVTDAADQPHPLWSGSFQAPVKFPPTDSFGTRRTFNGKLASIHKGMDFRAPTGTPVLAANSGTVVLAQHLYYEGNCVMIDHGQGLMSISMHILENRCKARPASHQGPANRPKRIHRPRHRPPPPLGHPLARRHARPSQTA